MSISWPLSATRVLMRGGGCQGLNLNALPVERQCLKGMMVDKRQRWQCYLCEESSRGRLMAEQYNVGFIVRRQGFMCGKARDRQRDNQDKGMLFLHILTYICWTSPVLRNKNSFRHGHGLAIFVRPPRTMPRACLHLDQISCRLHVKCWHQNLRT